MRNILEILKNYVYYNQLVISKETYLTIIIGQITVYAILLTFYQFIVSFQGTGKKSVLSYLGKNLIDYYVNKQLRFYNQIISKPLFWLLFVLEILYKPITSIYGNEIPKNIITELNFLWYVYAIFFFVIFALLFYKCTKCILSLKNVVDIRLNAYIISEINRNFKKKSFTERFKKKSIELLVDDMKHLRNAVAIDNNSELQTEYSKLVIEIFEDYRINKDKEIALLLNKNKRVKNQRAWIYNMDIECQLLNEFIKHKYIQMNDPLENYIIMLHLKLLDLNLQRALAEGFEKFEFDFYDYNCNSVNCKQWKELSVQLFRKCKIQYKKRMIEMLYDECHSDNRLLAVYCEKMLMYLIKCSICRVFEEKNQQEEFTFLFKYVLYDEKINYLYSKELCDQFIYHNEIDAVEMIELVNEKNCTYIFAYIVIYYSVYKQKDNWKSINITVLKTLVKNGNRLESEFDRIHSLILNSRINHRYKSIMLTKLVENVNKEINGKWLDEIYEQNYVDAFYITVIKLCVFGQTYCSFCLEGGIEAKISFINELERHKEVLAYHNVKEMFLRMRYTSFRQLRYLPKKLCVTLRTLLLIDMSISDELLNDEKQYFYYMSLGQYLLVKYGGESNISEAKRDLIRKAYVASNMPIQEYVDYLNNESCICGVELNYVKKEKMKNYLMNVI